MQTEDCSINFLTFKSCFKDAIKKANLPDTFQNPFLIINDSKPLENLFLTLFHDLVCHYRSCFQLINKNEQNQLSFCFYPEINFNARIAEALLSLLIFSEEKNVGWSGHDLGKYFTILFDLIFSLDSEGNSLFSCINSIKDQYQFQPGKPFILFSVTYIDEDLEGKRGFAVSLQALPPSY